MRTFTAVARQRTAACCLVESDTHKTRVEYETGRSSLNPALHWL